MTHNERVVIRFAKVFTLSKMLTGRRLSRKDVVDDIKGAIDQFDSLRAKFESAVKLISQETGVSENDVYLYIETIIGAAEIAGARGIIEVSDFVPIVVDFIQRERATSR